MAPVDDLHIFVTAGAMAHISTGDVTTPLVGLEMSSPEQIHPPGYGLVVESGTIRKIAQSEEILAEFGQASKIHDFEGRAIIPGFIDAHTHLLWDGDRSNEIRMRQQGMSYAEIADAGGGIRHTVAHELVLKEGKYRSHMERLHLRSNRDTASTLKVNCVYYRYTLICNLN